MLERLRVSIPFDAHAWLMTDPATEVGASPVAQVPCLDRLPELIGLKYRTRVNRWTGLADRAASLIHATQGRPEESALWRAMLRDFDVVDIASVVFRDRFGCWGFLDLWRIAPSPPFTERELATLGRSIGEITGILRRCQADTFTAAPTVRVPMGPTLLVLSSDLRVRSQTPQTTSLLRRLVPADAGDQPIPAGAYNVAAQLHAVEAAVDAHPPTARVHLAGGSWLTLKASRLADAVSGDPGDVAVSIESASPTERLDLFTRAFGLTRREGELVGHLTRGDDTRRLAARMHVSELTVQDHLKAVFDKTGVRSRHALLSRILGESSG